MRTSSSTTECTDKSNSVQRALQAEIPPMSTSTGSNGRDAATTAASAAPAIETTTLTTPAIATATLTTPTAATTSSLHPAVQLELDIAVPSESDSDVPRWVCFMREHPDRHTRQRIIRIAELSGRLDARYPKQTVAIIGVEQVFDARKDFIDSGYKVFWDEEGIFDDIALFKSDEIRKYDVEDSAFWPMFEIADEDASQLIATWKLFLTLFEIGLSAGKFYWNGESLDKTKILSIQKNSIDMLSGGHLEALTQLLPLISFENKFFGYSPIIFHLIENDFGGDAAEEVVRLCEQLLGCCSIWKRFIGYDDKSFERLLRQPERMESIREEYALESAISAYLKDGVPLEDILA